MFESTSPSSADTPEVGLDQAYASFLRVHTLVTREHHKMSQKLSSDSLSDASTEDVDLLDETPLTKDQFATWVTTNSMNPAAVEQWMQHLAERVTHDPAAEDALQGQAALSS